MSILPVFSLALAAQAPRSAPLEVGSPLPPLLDLRDADATVLVPKDPRDPAQAARAAEGWAPRIAALKDAPALRLRLPSSGPRVPLLLAASQALKAQTPGQRLYLAFDPAAEAILEESAWGSVDGGALGPEDLGPDPAQWRDRLFQAQNTFPGRPWTLWLPSDPGALTAALLGDGGRVVAPADTAAARLATAIPEGYMEVEGGLGDLLLRRRGSREARRWRFQEGAWIETALPDLRTEVAVVADEAYDVSALMAKVRAFALRERLAARTVEARMDVDLHLQSEKGFGIDLGFTFRAFERAGEGEELLQKEVRFNGVRAKVTEGLQLPIIESRSSLAPPVALALTERYRYRDNGAEGAGRRRLSFEPVDRDPLLWRGSLLVEEASGRILQEISERSDLPGTVRSERRTLTYGDAEGHWRIASVDTSERWATPGGVTQVLRRIRYRDLVVNGLGFEAARLQARASTATMLKATPDGVRYFTRQADGTRRVDLQARTGGRAIGGAILIDPGFSPPVLPAAGLAYYDFNAFNKGVQVNLFTAVLFNTASLAVPRLPGGFDLRANAVALLWPGGERPVQDGRLADKDEVARRFGVVNVAVGHDLGGGWRGEVGGTFRYDAFTESKDDKRRTPGFALPPSGWTTEGRLALSWLWRGFQLRGFHGEGRRPDGTYGTADAPQAVPDGGRFSRSGGSLGYDHQLGAGLWLHGDAGYVTGKGFDRFQAIDLGIGGEVRIAGIRSNAITADRLAYAKAGVVLPATAHYRLSLTLDHARARALDNQRTYALTGLGIAGDLPGFGWFTTVRIDLGVGLQSDIPGVRTVNGLIAFLRVF
ncbi:MAG: hypothetical protein IPL96_12835 [Holophagaceae bacterium]|nr:hypothetical protein [Holophagaceae bacterium]